MHNDNDSLHNIIFVCMPSLYNLSLCFPRLGAQALQSAHFGRGTADIFLDDVRCAGSEARLVDCPHDPGPGDCSHYEDASVICTGAIILHIANVEKLYKMLLMEIVDSICVYI